MKIITAPHPTLRLKAQEVKTFDRKFWQFLQDLEDTLVTQEAPKGVGLAAPQVNKSWQVFVAILAAKDNKSTFFINPRITAHSKDKILGLSNGEERFEGCLSVPKIYGPVPRYTWVEVEYLTFNPAKSKSGKILPLRKKKEKFTDFDARVIQHEYDHLNGVLFFDHSQKEALPLFVEKGDAWAEIENRAEVLAFFGQQQADPLL